MVHPVTRMREFLARESLSIHLILAAFALNAIAWIIPRGDYRHPLRDPLGAAAFVSERFSDVQALYYFWNGCLAVAVLIVGYSAYKVFELGLASLADRVDL